MSIFKCKMCGGTIEFTPGDSVGICDSCGTKQTLPKLDDDRRANLYDRANHFRRNNEFDKAAGIYEQILTEDTTDAEAYWSLVLCQYGIEYVEDPSTHDRVPTVNRAQFTSIFDDDNYKSALQYADGYQRELYEKEAGTINEIQKGILAISQKEEPFDVFICYKETDQSGRRTQDSVLANDLYHQLTQEGFKVFFARITLEDKLGTAYEPYIFAALNSAKVMVVLGTKPEHFNAVWVKNEWSRYLALVKKSGGKKILIPAYKDMDPYDLPEEFSHLQAQDMSKLGFMQDLIRGIKKIVHADEPKTVIKETVVSGGNNANVAPLLERVYLFLEDGKWQDANSYCEKVLDIDPKNAEAYLGKLMADLKVKTRKQLADCAKPFDDKENYGKVLRFGDEALEEEMRGYIDHINERNENDRLTKIYNSAVKGMKTANSEAAYKAVIKKLQSIPGFNDADSLAEQCIEKAEICRKDEIYALARSQMTGNIVNGYEAAIGTFRTISGWKDADEQIAACQRMIEAIKEREEKDRLEAARKEEERRIAKEKATKKRRKIIAVAAVIVVVCIAFIIVLTKVIIPKQKHSKAMRLLNSGDYEEAYKLLEEIGDDEAITSSKKDRVEELINSGDYEEAYKLLEEIGDDEAITSSKKDRAEELIKTGEYEEAYKLLEEIGDDEAITSSKKDRAEELIKTGEYEEAYKLLEEIGDDEAIATIKKDRAEELIKSGNYEEAYKLLKEIGDDEAIAPIKKNIAEELIDSGDYDEAYKLLEQIGDKDTISANKYDRAVALISSGDYGKAYPLLDGLDYKDSESILNSIIPQMKELSEAQVGSYVIFGSYEQDNNSSNGKEDIAWLVLAKDGDRALLISQYALDCKAYHTSDSAVTWETCSMREWLNGTFINDAFSADEQNYIQSTTVTADRNLTYNISPGNDTTDKVFLLSITEAEKYFSSSVERKCKGTAYCLANREYNLDFYWFLRSPGSAYNLAAIVNSVGSVDRRGAYVGTAFAVRPAMWINLKP